MTKKKLYLLLFSACIVGWLWVAIQIHFNSPPLQLCLSKYITNIPCPSCGSTRSILELIKGNFSNAFLWNPLGIISFIIMLISPIWIAIDLTRKKDSLLKIYLRMEIVIRKSYIATPLIIAVLANWIWNIYKGL